MESATLIWIRGTWLRETPLCIAGVTCRLVLLVRRGYAWEEDPYDWGYGNTVGDQQVKQTIYRHQQPRRKERPALPLKETPLGVRG